MIKSSSDYFAYCLALLETPDPVVGSITSHCSRKQPTPLQQTHDWTQLDQRLLIWTEKKSACLN